MAPYSPRRYVSTMTTASMIRSQLETFVTAHRQDLAAVVAVRVIELTEVVDSLENEVGALRDEVRRLKS
jgi:hypothetical protein